MYLKKLLETCISGILHHLNRKGEYVICDLDGTLCLMDGRGPFEFDKCNKDKVNYPVMTTLKALYSAGYRVIFMSGRKNSCEQLTRGWLDRYWARPYELYMRDSRDNRNDGIVKEELYRKNVYPRSILLVLDDRPRVIRTWMSLKLPVFNVNGISEEF